MLIKNVLRTAPMAIALAAFTLTSSPVEAQGVNWSNVISGYTPTWERIRESGYLTTGCVVGQNPYWMKDPASGDM